MPAHRLTLSTIQIGVRGLVLALYRQALRRSIRFKIMGMVLGLVLALGLTVSWQVRQGLATDLGEQLDERGIALARDLAARSTDLILTNNTFALYELVRDTVENNKDVRYAFLVDTGGRVLVHSFGPGFPADLLRVNRLPEAVPYQIQVLDSAEGLIHDVAAPIFEGRAGVARVGMSERRMRAAIESGTRNVILATLAVLLAGIVTSFMLTRFMTQPIVDLVAVARDVGRGDLSRKAQRWMDDEIGQLSIAFNRMIDQLARSRDDLLRQNRDLVTLNAIAAAISGSRSLDEVLATALEQTLIALDCPAGWIVLPQAEDQRLVMTAYQGVPETFVQREMAADTPQCLCLEVMHQGQPRLIPKVRETCPRLERAQQMGLGFCCHLSVPLEAHDKALGVMNIVSDGRHVFSDDEVTLAAAIGRQVGVAVENARLWEELRLKEAMRGHLLEKVITAQEDERKRIARELHDEAGPSLTSLMVRLRLIENVAGNEAEVRRQTGELKALAGQILDDLHRLAVELRPSSLDHLGLVAALNQYIRTYARQHGITADFQAIGFDGKRLPPGLETSLYRIVQEALTNVARHSRATQVGVVLEHRGPSVVAIVEDNGCGFDVAQVLQGETGRLGLFGMQERATLIGGRLTLESAPGQGTTVFAEIPLTVEC